MVANSALADTQADGAFKRQASVWRDTIAKGTRFEPEAGRYHLYIALGCPWACRTYIALHLKGLDHVIGVSITHPTWQRTKRDDPNDQHAGWTFTSPDDPPLSNPAGFGSIPCTGTVPDPLNGARFVRDLYEKAGQKGGRYTVPVLWDSKEQTIVNNESSEILRIFNSAFNDLAKYPEVDLYPEALRGEIDALNEWVYNGINNGVYRCGFAQKQGAYEEAFKDVFSSLDRVEALLSKQRFLVGNQLTEADVRLFVTLIRFDAVYVTYFKTSRRFIREYPALSGYVRDLHSIPGFAKGTNMQHIKLHYFTSHPSLNPYAIVPVGSEEELFLEPAPERAALGPAFTAAPVAAAAAAAPVPAL